MNVWNGRRLVVAVTLWTACGTAWAQGAATTQPAQKIIRFPGIAINLTAREIRVDTTVCLRQGALELILCRKGTKEHESILHTSAQAAHVHAGLLAMGLAPGRAAEWSFLVGEGHGALIPPRGAALSVHLEWKSPQGKARRADVADWMAATRSDGNKRVPLPKHWIFVGSDILDDGRYWADCDGDIISVSNFASTVIDVPFESSDKAALLSYQANTASIPPLKTPVTVVIKPLPNAENAPDARVTYRIGRKGNVYLAERKLTFQQLVTTTEAMVKKHPRTMVVLRTHPETLAHDIALVKRELMTARVPETRVEHGFAREGKLPQNQAELDRVIVQWKDKFEKGDRMLIEPGQESAEVLVRLRAALKRAENRRDILNRYETWLARARGQYVVTTQPAEKANDQ